jgi:drug/metabolite transporter (DMT)-like permease
MIMELWFVLAVVAILLWGFAQIFAKLSTSKVGVARVAVLVAVVNGALYFLGFYYWHENVPISLVEGALALASCIAGITAYLCYF